MPKRLELLHEVTPDAAKIAYLIESESTVAIAPIAPIAQEAARTIGVELQVERVATDVDLDQTLSGLVRAGAKALLIGSSAYFNDHSKQLSELCVRYKLPAVYQRREFVSAGGLMSYGPSLADAYRIVGEYAGRVLKGVRPADLPVQQQTKVDFSVNLKTAKALGITFTEFVSS